jgi:hypothetical protein
LALALNTGLLPLVSQEIFSPLHADIIIRKRGAKRSPGTFVIGEIGEGFFEENRPFYADELEEDCLEKFLVDIYYEKSVNNRSQQGGWLEGDHLP